MLIHINRKIFKSLTDDLQKTYIIDTVDSALYDTRVSESNYTEISNAIYGLITSLENLIEDVGYNNWYSQDYSASKEVCGFWHQTGKYGVSFFDLGPEENEPDSIDYSFEIWECL